MHSLTNPVRSLPHVLLHYLATGFGKPEVPALVSGGGMPADTVLFDSQSAVLSFTCVAAPMFRAKIERLAIAQSIDVMLVRCCLTGGDLLPVSVDVVLGGGGLTPFKLQELALYRHEDGALWLVPFGFGAAIMLEPHGLELYLVPPYATLVERAAGIYRVASDLAESLYPRAVS
jgi:hypothetical protein